MRAGDWRAAAAALLVAAAAWRLAHVARAAAPAFTLAAACPEQSDRNIEAGEALLHGLPHDRVSWSMPAYTLAGALVCHASPKRPALLPKAALWAGAGGVFALGAALAGPLGGGAAAALYAFTLDARDVFNDRWAYVLAVILVGLAAVWRARRPSAARSAALGASVGFSLLFLSTLFLYPAAVAAAAAARRRWKEACLAALLPALFLVPWALMNWRVWGEFVPLERGRAVTNVITGAAGVVHAVWFEDSRALTGMSERSPWRWAAKEVAAHPLRYLDAVARRAAAAAGPHPLLLLLACAALLLKWREPPVRALGLLAAYFLGVHCLMAVESRYFAPLWPLAAALAAALLASERDSPRARGRAAALPAAPLVLWAAAFASWTLWLTLAFPARAAAAGALARELSLRPDDAWLWTYQGRGLLERGLPAQALASFERAYALAPDPDREYLRALAGAVQGKSPPPELLARQENEQRVRLLVALWDFSSGRAEAGWRSLDAAATELEARRRSRWTRTSPEWTARSMEATRVGLAFQVLQSAAHWPVRDQARLLRGLARRSGEGPGFHIGAAALSRAALKASRARAASAPEAAGLLALSLELAERADRLDEDHAAALTDLAVSLGRAPEAAASLRRAVLKDPDVPGLFLELARAETAAGRTAAAVAALARASALSPGPDLRRRIDSVSREAEGRSAVRALALFARGDFDGGFAELSAAGAPGAMEDYCGHPGRDCGAWRRAEEKVKAVTDEGMAAFARKDAAGADRSFGRVLRWRPDAPDALMNKAAAASALGRLEEAEGLYDRALKAPSVVPGLTSELLSSRAAVRERRGRPAEASADLRAALDAAPADWPRRAETRERLAKLTR